MTFYFNSKNQPEKSMPQQVNKPLTDDPTVRFTDEPVSTSENISSHPKKAQEASRKKQNKKLKKNWKICRELLKKLPNQKLKQELHQLNQEYKSKDKNDTDDSED